jgi:restriction system protein
MARGMMPRPPSNAGRPQPPRRGGQPRQSRDAVSGKLGQRLPGNDQIRQRQAEQQRQAAAKAAATQQRLRQQQYLREAQGIRRREDARRQTAEVDRQVARLVGILQGGLGRSARIDLDSLQQASDQSRFDPGALGTPAPEPVEADFAPSRFGGGWGGRASKERREAAAKQAFQQARDKWEAGERERKQKLADAERRHGAQLAEQSAEVDQYRSRISRVAAGLRDRDPKAVESFVRTVLRRVPLPVAFPRRAEVRHNPVEEQVTVRMVMPGPEIVPEVIGYECEPPRYELVAVPRPDEEVEQLYRIVLAQVALLVVRDLFEAEAGLDSVSLQGLVDAADPVTGEPDLSCVIRLTADRETFEGLDLNALSPEEALQDLDASITPDPYTSQPV